MSLFNTRNFWSVKCESDNEETFDQQCLYVDNVFDENDNIIVGNHDGFLWVFRPKLSDQNNEKNAIGFSATDQLIEVKLSFPILQVKTGYFVSGSQNKFIGVLHPKHFAVYDLKSRKGLTDYGDETQLLQMYEHKLQRQAYSFIIGEFGGVVKRDFICIQSLDGVLSFYEQEIFTFCCFLPDILLPGPLAFVSRSDIFVTIGADWNLHVYSYKLLSEAGVLSNESQTIGKKIEADWKYNISEPAIDIISLPNNSFESYIIILGEHNLYCLNDLGKLKFMKRFEFIPLCFYPYLLEPENKLMILVVSDTKTLLIYENTLLRWSAQLEFLPVAISRDNFSGIRGALTILSENGNLQCSYLGTVPSQFIIPPYASKEIDFATVEEELQQLQNVIDSHANINAEKMASIAMEKEFLVTITVNHELLSCAYPTNIPDDNNLKMCEIKIDAVPQIPFDEVQIIVNVVYPLVSEPSSFFMAKLDDRVQYTCYIFQKEAYNIVSLCVTLIITCITNTGVPRVLRKTAYLPLKLVANVCAPLKDNAIKITINTSEPAVPLPQLFPEFAGENALALSSNAIGFLNILSVGNPVTIVTAKTSQRYRVQADSLSILNLMTQELIQRLKIYFLKNKSFSISITGGLPLQHFLDDVQKHFDLRKATLELENELTQSTVQFRMIQKRLMGKYKEKNPTVLDSLDFLLHESFNATICVLQKLLITKYELNKQQCHLKSGIELLLHLAQLYGISDETYNELKSALNIDLIENDVQGWEETVEMSLNYLLRTAYAMSEKDRLRASSENITQLTNIAKLKKYLTVILERTVKLQFAQADENKNDFEKEKEDETLNVTVPVGSRLAELKSERPPSGRARAPVLLQLRKARQNEIF